jgi:hypothetical protein
MSAVELAVVWRSFYRAEGVGGGGSTGGRPTAISGARFSSKEKQRGGETGEPRRWRGGGAVSGRGGDAGGEPVAGGEGGGGASAGRWWRLGTAEGG